MAIIDPNHSGANYGAIGPGSMATSTINDGFDRQTARSNDIEERLAAVEARLYIIHANIEMEELYPELKAAYAKYKAVLDQINTFHTIKTST